MLVLSQNPILETLSDSLHKNQQIAGDVAS